jgi:hypothetical protein
MDINQQTKKYIVQCIILVFVLNLLGHLVMRFWAFDIVVPMAVSMIFVLVVEIASVLIWRWVALKHRDMLPSFFTGVSGFRFLLALAVMFVVWYVVEDAKTMKTFFIVFLIYYMTSMIHHSIFFSRMSNRL